MSSNEIYFGPAFEARSTVYGANQLVAQNWEAAKQQVVDAAHFMELQGNKANGANSSPHSFTTIATSEANTITNSKAVDSAVAEIRATSTLNSAMNDGSMVGGIVKKLSAG